MKSLTEGYCCAVFIYVLPKVRLLRPQLGLHSIRSTAIVALSHAYGVPPHTCLSRIRHAHGNKWLGLYPIRVESEELCPTSRFTLLF